MIVGIIVAVIALILGVVVFVHFQNKQYDKISFKETLDLTGLPIITFHHKDAQNNDIKLNFLLDTGATNSIIHAPVVNVCKTVELQGQTVMCGLEGTNRTASNVGIILERDGKEFRDAFQVSDMSSIFGQIKEVTGATLHGVLGDSFFRRYKYVIDFEDYIAYSKGKR